jgi:malonyl-CoA O-methyltransferase
MLTQTVDKQLVRNRFRKQLHQYSHHASLQLSTAQHLVDALTGLKGGAFPRVLEIGCGSGALTRFVAGSLKMRTFYVNDLVEDCRSAVASVMEDAAATTTQFIAGDIEDDLPLPAELDLVISNATFQWLEDIGALLSRLAVLLRPGGVLAFSTFGPDNLREIRDLTGVGLAYPPGEAITDLLQRDFRLLHEWQDTVTMQFKTPLEVVTHLRRTGVNAVRQTTWQRSALDRFVSAYRERWSVGESVALTYHPMIFVAEKR